MARYTGATPGQGTDREAFAARGEAAHQRLGHHRIPNHWGAMINDRGGSQCFNVRQQKCSPALSLYTVPQ